MNGGQLHGEPPRTRTPRQVDVLAAFVEAGGSVSQAAKRIGIRPSTAKRHLADLRAHSGLTTEQLIYRGRGGGMAGGTDPGATVIAGSLGPWWSRWGLLVSR
jgi:molybdenum-dependent DNA-binding transcriptional regulator ModE